MEWQELDRKTLVKTPPFDVEEVSLKDLKTLETFPHRYYRIAAPSWVNVFAVTPQKKVILVRQPRVGMMQNTLELPGGNMDEGEAPELAAARELEEETGYRPKDLITLGVVSPNPAIMNNRLHMYLALGCAPPSQRERFPDQMERIDLRLVSVPELEELIKSGQFQSALSCLTALTALRYGSFA